ncbi:MAG: hypothetical protein AAGB04_20160 [Pseudomonadota bacterium]
MQPLDQWAHGTQLLKLLNEIDQCRVELDQAIARNDTELANQVLAKFKELAGSVDKLRELDNQKRPIPSPSDVQRLASEA